MCFISIKSITAQLHLAGPPLQIEERYIVPGTGVALKAFTALSITPDRRFRYPVSCFARILFLPARQPHQAPLTWPSSAKR